MPYIIQEMRLHRIGEPIIRLRTKLMVLFGFNNTSQINKKIAYFVLNTLKPISNDELISELVGKDKEVILSIPEGEEKQFAEIAEKLQITNKTLYIVAIITMSIIEQEKNQKPPVV